MHHNCVDEEKIVNEVSRNRISSLQIASSWKVHTLVIPRLSSPSGGNKVGTAHYTLAVNDVALWYIFS